MHTLRKDSSSITASTYTDSAKELISIVTTFYKYSSTDSLFYMSSNTGKGKRSDRREIEQRCNVIKPILSNLSY